MACSRHNTYIFDKEFIDQILNDYYLNYSVEQKIGNIFLK